MVRTTTDANGIVIAGDDAELIDEDVDDDRVAPDDKGVELITDGGTDVEYTHSVNASDLSVGDAVRLSHADVVVTQTEAFDTDEYAAAPKIGDHDFGYMRLSNSQIAEGHVAGVSAARNAEAVANGDFFDFDGDTIPDDAIDLRAGFVTCGKCDAVVDADEDPWASVSVSPHGSNDRDASFAVSLCGSCSGDVAEATGHDRTTVDDDPELITDGGRPLSSYDHAPDVAPEDVDKCRECGRYAPHDFDHAPACSRFKSIDQELSSRTAASNSRMVQTATDGGTRFDKPPQSPELIASSIVAATEGDDVAVFASGTDATLSIYEGTVTSTGYQDDPDHSAGGTHVVAIDVAGDTVAVHFDRVVDDWELTTPEPVLFDPVKDAHLPVTRFEGVDD